VSFEDKLTIHAEIIDGIGPWTAIKGDRALTATIPDWKNYARDEVLRLCPPDKRRVVVEAGGHIGIYPRLFSEHFEVVYAFEPNPLMFHCLAVNCQEDNIVKIQTALGSESGLIHSNFCEDNTGASNVTSAPGAYIPALPLDAFTLDAFDLFWLDVEGFETKCLYGAQAHIEKFKPVVVLERADPDAYEFLSQRGYRLHCVHNIDHFFVPR
jgi:FkbM family methyltransferase